MKSYWHIHEFTFHWRAYKWFYYRPGLEPAKYGTRVIDTYISILIYIGLVVCLCWTLALLCNGSVTMGGWCACHCEKHPHPSAVWRIHEVRTPTLSTNLIASSSLNYSRETTLHPLCKWCTVLYFEWKKWTQLSGRLNGLWKMCYLKQTNTKYLAKIELLLIQTINLF